MKFIYIAAIIITFVIATFGFEMQYRYDAINLNYDVDQPIDPLPGEDIFDYELN